MTLSGSLAVVAITWLFFGFGDDDDDGLWDDGRTDEGQLGLSYKELEEAMDNEKSINRDKYIKINSKNLILMQDVIKKSIEELNEVLTKDKKL